MSIKVDERQNIKIIPFKWLFDVSGQLLLTRKEKNVKYANIKYATRKDINATIHFLFCFNHFHDIERERERQVHMLSGV